jgi:hypothetical protein
LDFTGLTTEEMIEKWKREHKKFAEKQEQEEKDLQEGKYIFIF